MRGAPADRDGGPGRLALSVASTVMWKTGVQTSVDCGLRFSAMRKTQVTSAWSVGAVVRMEPRWLMSL
jgi:hypothetical protein